MVEVKNPNPTRTTRSTRTTRPAGTGPANSAAVAESRSLSSDQLAELLRLLRGADSVELKLTVPDGDRRSAVAGLGMDPLDAQVRQVAFFDTPDLALDAAGVVVRARRIQGRVGDSVIKLRPVEPTSVSNALRKAPAFGVEVDAMPGGFVCSGRMKMPAQDAAIKDVINGQRPLRKLFTKEQRELFAAHAPAGVTMDDLYLLGPVNVMKLKFTPVGFDQRMVAELWFYPGGERILELSTKCVPGDAFDVAARVKVFLSERGIDLAAEQQTKTRTALDFFARELATTG